MGGGGLFADVQRLLRAVRSQKDDAVLQNLFHLKIAHAVAGVDGFSVHNRQRTSGAEDDALDPGRLFHGGAAGGGLAAGVAGAVLVTGAATGSAGVGGVPAVLVVLAVATVEALCLNRVGPMNRPKAARNKTAATARIQPVPPRAVDSTGGNGRAPDGGWLRCDSFARLSASLIRLMRGFLPPARGWRGRPCDG